MIWIIETISNKTIDKYDIKLGSINKYFKYLFGIWLFFGAWIGSKRLAIFELFDFFQELIKQFLKHII